MKKITPYQQISSLEDYLAIAKQLESILDFYRFAISLAVHKIIYYGHGTDNPRDEFSFLILEALGLDYDYPANEWHARLPLFEKNYLAELLFKRIELKIPAPYLVNKAYFCQLPFYVNEDVLIPRSPIAELIENRFAPWIEEERVESILDLCTGSGCIAAAMSYAFPVAQVDAIDIDNKALKIAQKNIEDLGLEGTIRLIQSDGMDALVDERYDIIVSNPPYVSHDEMQTLPLEYTHEPQLALEAEDLGLALVHRILKDACKFLKPKGILVVEVGNSDHALIEAYPDMPFIWLEFERGGHGIFLLMAEDLKAYFA